MTLKEKLQLSSAKMHPFLYAGARTQVTRKATIVATVAEQKATDLSTLTAGERTVRDSLPLLPRDESKDSMYLFDRGKSLC